MGDHQDVRRRRLMLSSCNQASLPSALHAGSKGRGTFSFGWGVGIVSQMLRPLRIGGAQGEQALSFPPTKMAFLKTVMKKNMTSVGKHLCTKTAALQRRTDDEIRRCQTTRRETWKQVLPPSG